MKDAEVLIAKEMLEQELKPSHVLVQNIISARAIDDHRTSLEMTHGVV